MFVQAAITLLGFWRPTGHYHYAVDQPTCSKSIIDFANLPLAGSGVDCAVVCVDARAERLFPV